MQLNMGVYKNYCIVIMLAIFTFCSDADPEIPDDDDQVVSVKNGLVTVKPIEYYTAIRNPMKGLREYFNPALHLKRDEYPYPYGTIIKEYMQWDNLENVESDEVDKVIAYSNHRWEGVEDINMKVIPRPYIVWREPWLGGLTTEPENPDDLRGSHWPADIPGETYSEDPDTPITGGYFDSSFQERVKKLVKKLGEAWDNDPRVAYIEMGIVGCWGEHHDPDISTYWPPHTQEYHVANRTWIPGIEKTLGDAFTEAFQNKKVMVRYAYDFKEYDFGVFWDSFALPQEENRGYNEMMKLGDRWKAQPMGGEISWARGDHAQFDSFEELIADSATQARVIKHIRNLHINHIGGVTWADFSNTEFLANAAIIQKNLGYRFVIKEFSYPTIINTNTSFSISLDVVNTGSSPFYYNWPLEVSLLDSETKEQVWSTVLNNVNISEWMPGDVWDSSKKAYTIDAETNNMEANVTMDEDIPDGKYIISIAVLDPAGMLPSLRFAAINYFEGGRHPMGYIGVNTEIDEYEIPVTEFDDLGSETTLHYELD